MIGDQNEDELVTIIVVPDVPCPFCGAVADHEDESLRFMNRPKVQLDGVWWWKCYNPRCPVDYYNPETGAFDAMQCRYFVFCDQLAVTTVDNPVIGPVPTCQRCLERIEALS